MDNNIINNIYVDLDSIVDTRLSLMYDIDKNVMRDLIERDRYHNRFNDQFGYISVKLFNILYKMRNSNILENPIGTEIVDVISDYCLESTLTAKSYGEFKPLTIYLNIWPYELTEENIELIRMGLNNSTKMSVNVEILNKPNKDILPSWIRSNIGLMIMYDGMSWVDYHLNNKDLISNAIPDVTLLTPALIPRNSLIAKREMSKFFEDIEKSVSILVGLQYVPVRLFSFNKDLFKENKKDNTDR